MRTAALRALRGVHGREIPAAREARNIVAGLEFPRQHVRVFFPGRTSRRFRAEVLPVFIAHARDNHAERGALQALLASAKGKRGVAALYAAHTPCVSCLAGCMHVAELVPGVSLRVAFDTWEQARSLALALEELPPAEGTHEVSAS